MSNTPESASAPVNRCTRWEIEDGRCPQSRQVCFGREAGMSSHGPRHALASPNLSRQQRLPCNPGPGCSPPPSYPPIIYRSPSTITAAKQFGQGHGPSPRPSIIGRPPRGNRRHYIRMWFIISHLPDRDVDDACDTWPGTTRIFLRC